MIGLISQRNITIGCGIMPKGKKSIRDFLTNDLSIQINEIWRKGKSYQDSQKGDTIQSSMHCRTVEANLSKLIPDEKKAKELEPIELFVISASACLHDVGKVVDDDAKGWKSDHGKRSMEIILDQYDELGLDRGQAIAVGYIVSVHGTGKLEEIPRPIVAIGGEEVDIVKIAAIFRLADVLDTNYQRAPEILSKIKFPDGNIPPKWRGRQSITGWYLDEKDRIILQAVPKEEEIDAAYTLKAMMNEDLSVISPYLRLAGYPYEFGELDVGDVFLKSDLKDRAIRERPFPGMAFYTKQDVDIFRGREEEIDKLLPIINKWQISLLIGESGSGKTSLIYAGLFPRLDSMRWKYIWSRPFEDPINNIKKIVWSAFFEGNVDNKATLTEVMKQAAQKCKPHHLLIVMDQFEDILNCSVKEILDDFALDLMAVQTGTIIPNLRVLISFRHDASIKLNTRLLKKITGSAQQFPSVEIERLTREGAKSALLAGMERAGIGLDPRKDEGQKELIEIILDDIQKADDRLYPPYVQMVAETLCKKIDPHSRIITRETYLDELKAAENIIAHYLLTLLNEFGEKKEIVKKILISLTSSEGKKAQKKLTELSKEMKIDIPEMKNILNKMIDLRMIRTIGTDEYEIIHDHVGEIVDKEFIEDEDRKIKFLEEQLNSFYQNYKIHGTPIISPPFMASLYRKRKRIIVDEEKYPLILCTIFYAEATVESVGLGWYWLRDMEQSHLFELLESLLDHKVENIGDEAREALVKIAKKEYRNTITNLMDGEHPNVRMAAIEALGKIAQPEDRDKIIEMLHDKDSDVRRAAREALGKIVQPEDRDKIIEMLHDKDGYVRRAAREALRKIPQPEDRDKIIELFYDKDSYVRRAAREALGKIVQPEDRDKIIEMLHDKDSYVRRAAIEALGKIVQPEDRDKIIEMLHDKDGYVRMAAREALGKIVQPEDRDKIIEMLHDKDSDVRRAAIEALGKIAQPEDRDKIIEMFYDEDLEVQKCAVETLYELKDERYIDTIIDFIAEKAEGFSDISLEFFEQLCELDKELYCPYYKSEEE